MMRSFSAFWLSKASKLEQVWMTHLFNLMDFDSFQPVTGIPPLGCIAGNFLASYIVVLSLPPSSSPRQSMRSEGVRGFCLWKEKINYCMSSTFWLRLYPFRNLLLVHCLSLVRFLSFPLLPLSLAFFLHFLSLVPFFLHGVNWARVPLCISEGKEQKWAKYPQLPARNHPRGCYYVKVAIPRAPRLCCAVCMSCEYLNFLAGAAVRRVLCCHLLCEPCCRGGAKEKRHLGRCHVHVAW